MRTEQSARPETRFQALNRSYARASKLNRTDFRTLLTLYPRHIGSEVQ